MSLKVPVLIIVAFIFFCTSSTWIGPRNGSVYLRTGRGWSPLYRLCPWSEPLTQVWNHRIQSSSRRSPTPRSHPIVRRQCCPCKSPCGRGVTFTEQCSHIVISGNWIPATSFNDDAVPAKRRASAGGAKDERLRQPFGGVHQPQKGNYQRKLALQI